MREDHEPAPLAPALSRPRMTTNAVALEGAAYGWSRTVTVATPSFWTQVVNSSGASVG